MLIAPPAELMPATQFLWVMWAAGALFLGVRWLARWWSLRAAIKDAPDLGPHLTMDAPVPVKAVASFLEPGLVAIFRPVIVMPRGIAEALSPGEMRAVLAHEISHLSRRDNLWASIQMLVEMLFWFHPLVWWIGARLVVERERACDETVLETGNAPRTYAESILKICRFHLQPSPACVSGVSGGNLKARVGAIMVHRRSADADGARILLLGSLGLTAVLLPLLAGAPGGAPVSQLARQVASSVLYAPGLLALPQMKFVTPSAPHVEPPVIRVAEAPPAAPPPLAETALAAEVIIAPVVERTASVITTKVSAAPPQSGSDEVFCRKPQRVPGSRLLGPSVCLKVGEWEALRAEGRDITPDGRATMIVAAPVVEKRSDVIVTKVSAALPPLASAEPVAAETQDDRVVCRQPQRLSGSRLFGRSVCLKASAWADLKAQGRDIGPDGRTMTVLTFERERSLYPPTCPSLTSGGIRSTAGMPRGVCL